MTSRRRLPVAAVLLVALTACAPGTRRPVSPDGIYQLGLRLASHEPALHDVLLVVSRAELTSDGLVLRGGFANRGEQRFGVEGPGLAEDARLMDSRGHVYRLRRCGDALLTVAPAGGFEPGAANVGDLVFPRPRVGGPLTLLVPAFPPARFELATAFQTPPKLPNGTVLLDKVLHNHDPNLAMIELRVKRVEVGPTVRFTVAFANTTRQGWDLTDGPTGGDARLLDGEGSASPPRAVSDNLRRSIAPSGGWKPGAEHVGSIEFARPAEGGSLRLVFPRFDALLLTVGSGGLVARVTNAGGEAPAPPPKADRQDVVFRQVSELLERQARALLAPDPSAYADTFAPALQAGQKRLAMRVGTLPLDSYSLSPSPDADLTPDAFGHLRGVNIVVRYHLRGVPEDNTFLNSLRYEFEPADGGDGWRVGRVGADHNAPFWQLGEVVVRSTPHFLILSRPSAEGGGAALAADGEYAYRRLASLDLPLAERYVGHLTATQAEFASLAGRDAQTAGVATWRYDINGDNISVYSCTFYLNGACLNRGGANAGERRTTLVHELTHLALAGDTRPITPAWLVEGLAVHYSGETTENARRVLTLDGLERVDVGRLTRAARLGLPVPGLTRDERQARFEYDFSGQVVDYLMRLTSPATVLGFFHSFCELPVQTPSHARAGNPETADEQSAADAERCAEATDAALQRWFGRSVGQLDAEVKNWLRQSYGLAAPNLGQPQIFARPLENR